MKATKNIFFRETVSKYNGFDIIATSSSDTSLCFQEGVFIKARNATLNKYV